MSKPKKKERNANATDLLFSALGQGASTNKSLSQGINSFIKSPDSVAQLDAN